MIQELGGGGGGVKSIEKNVHSKESKIVNVDTFNDLASINSIKLIFHRLLMPTEIIILEDWFIS